VELSGQLHFPAACNQEKELPVPFEQEVRLAPEPVWTLWSREKSLASAGN
jgi:hypothetical protein